MGSRKSGKSRSENVPIAEAKMSRVLHLAIFLMRGHRTVNELAERFDTNKRTVYRYLHLIEDLGWGLDLDFDRRYFIVDDLCPMCGKVHKKDFLTYKDILQPTITTDG